MSAPILFNEKRSWLKLLNLALSGERLQTVVGLLQHLRGVVRLLWSRAVGVFMFGT